MGDRRRMRLRADTPRLDSGEVTDEMIDAAARQVIPALNRIAEKTVSLPAPVACPVAGCRRDATKALRILVPEGLMEVPMCKTDRERLLVHFWRTGQLRKHDGKETVDLTFRP